MDNTRFETRRFETRFEIFKADGDTARDVLRSLMLEEDHSPQVIETIYYLDDIRDVRSRVRLRIYHTGSNSRAFLEFKEEGDGTNSKTRMELDNQCVSLLEQEGPHPISELVAAEAFVSFTGLNLSNYEAMSATGAVVCVRSYFQDDETGVRVTLDEDERFFGYFGPSRDKRLIIGRSNDIKLEIKGCDSSYVGAVLGAVRQQVDLKDLDDRETLLGNLYVQMLFEQVVDRKSVNEVPGKEIEIKLEVPPESDFLDLVYKRLSDDAEDPLWSTKPTGIYVRDDMLINFGFKDQDNRMQEGMVIIVDGLERGFAMKIKRASDPAIEGSLVRDEKVEIYRRSFNDEDRVSLQRSAEKFLGVKLVEIGEIEKLKKYIVIENRESGRLYKLCLDRCRHGGHELNQVEIEYKGLPAGTEVSDRPEDAIIHDIKCEIDVLVGWLRNNFGLELSTTYLTKFNWLTNL